MTSPASCSTAEVPRPDSRASRLSTGLITSCRGGACSASPRCAISRSAVAIARSSNCLRKPLVTRSTCSTTHLCPCAA